jgi:hypothetical protein
MLTKTSVLRVDKCGSSNIFHHGNERLNVQNNSSVRVTLSKILFRLQGRLCAEKNLSSRTAPQRSEYTVFSTVSTAHEAHQTSHIAGFSEVSRGCLYLIFRNIIFSRPKNHIYTKLDLIWYWNLRALHFDSVNSEKYDKSLPISLCYDNSMPERNL